MKTSLSITLALALSLSYSQSVLADDKSDATRVAQAWSESLFEAKTSITSALSDVPFSFDKKRVIQDTKELRDLYDQVAKQKGARKLKITKVEVIDLKPSSRPAGVSDDTVAVAVYVEGEAILVFVDPTRSYRVVGFSD